MANFRVQIVPAGTGAPIRVDTETEVFDFDYVRVGADKIPLQQTGSGLTAKLDTGGFRLQVVAAIDDLDVPTWSQTKTYVQDNFGSFEFKDSVLTQLTAPPLLPATGARYMIIAPATGDWAGLENQLAEWTGTAWTYEVCTLGTFVLVDDQPDGYFVKSSTVWSKKRGEAITASGGLTRVVDDISIATSGVTEGKIDTGAVTENKIGTGAVTNTKIGTGAVSDTKIDTGAVTETKISALAVTEGKIAASAVTEGKIGTGAVTNTKLGDSAVSEIKIADGAVTEGKIYAGAVTVNKLATNAVTEIKISTGAVTNTKIGSGAVSQDKMANDSVGTPQLIDSAVTAAKIGTSAVLGDKLSAVYRARIGITGALSYEAYTSSYNISLADTYPAALSKVDTALHTLQSQIPLEQVFTSAGQIGFTVTDFTFNSSNSVPDIIVTVNGKIQTINVDYTKLNSSDIQFTYTVPSDALVVVHMERALVPTPNVITVSEGGVVVSNSCTNLDFDATGFNVADLGGGHITVTNTGTGGGGASLGSVDQDIVPDASNTRYLGSTTKGWKALYLSDIATGDIYKLQVNNGILEAELVV